MNTKGVQAREKRPLSLWSDYIWNWVFRSGNPTERDSAGLDLLQRIATSPTAPNAWLPACRQLAPPGSLTPDPSSPPPVPVCTPPPVPQDGLTLPTTSTQTSVLTEVPMGFSLTKRALALVPRELGFSFGSASHLSLSKIILFASLFIICLLPLECKLSEDRDFATAKSGPSMEQMLRKCLLNE